MAKIPSLCRDWLRSLKKEKGKLFELHRGEGGSKDIHCSAHNVALFVDLFYNIFYVNHLIRDCILHSVHTNSKTCSWGTHFLYLYHYYMLHAFENHS